MTMLPPASDTPQPPCIIPTRQTRWVATQLIAALADEGGYDAVLRLHAKVKADQWPALVAILLNTGRVGGRPAMRTLQFTDVERRHGHAAYAAGGREPQVIEAEREYQRLHKRNARKLAS